MTFKVKDGLSVGANTIIDGSGNITTPANAKATLANGSTTAALNLGTGSVDPSALAIGDVWNNAGALKIRFDGSTTKTIAYTDSNITGTAGNVTGTVVIARGGTNGSASPTAGAVAYGNGSAYAFTAPGTSGQYLTSNGTGAPSWQSLSATSTNATFVAITDDTSSASANYVHFGAAITNNDSVKVSSTKLTFVPSTGNLTTTGSVGVGSVGQTTAGVIFTGSTSGTTTLKASAAAGTNSVITLPGYTGNVITSGDTGTVTSTMIADGTITNTDINASAAIAVSKLAANTISGVTLGNPLNILTLGTGLTGTSYNGSAAVTTGLATIAGLTPATYGSSTAIPVITVDGTGRITSASTSTVTIGAGGLSASSPTAGLTATTVALNFSALYTANSSSSVTINPVVGPSITALATIMAAAPNGILSKTGVDTYGIATNAPTATKFASTVNIQGVAFDGSGAITVATGGTGVTVTGTSIAIGQAVGTSSNVQFQAIGVGQAAGTVGTITATSFNGITGLSSTISAVASGTGAVGTGATVARADHVHPPQTTVSGNAGSVTDGAYLSATNTFTGTNAFNGTTAHSFGNVVASTYTGYFTLGGRAIRKVTSGSAIEIVDAAGTTATHTFGDAGTLAVTGAITGSSFNNITGLSSTTPVVAGTATIGVATTAAKADHVHPLQTTVSGLAGSATVLATARNINGVAFDGSANITVADSTKMPLSGGTFTGQFNINYDAPSICFQDTNHMTATLHCNGNNFYVLRNPTANATSWDSGPNSRHPMTLSLSSGDVIFSGNVTAYSDERLKKNIFPIANSLDKVSALNGVMFERLEGQKGTGLIAQNVHAVIPEAVTEDKDGYLSVSYGNLVGLLVEAIKELKQEIETLKNK